LETNEKINQFLKILKHQHPEHYDRFNFRVSSKSNYQQFRGMDGVMRAELNYNSPVTYEYIISFPNIGLLYYDMCFYIDYMWGGGVDVVATFDYDGTNYFKFTI
jgi:hypothetical protein